MPLSMLSYGKMILEKVSFDKGLFWKEYNKFCQELRKEECYQLSEWIITKYQNSPLVKVDVKKE